MCQNKEFIGSSFFEHPLCKEMDIKNLVTEPRSKRRTLQRRGAINMLASTQDIPDEMYIKQIKTETTRKRPSRPRSFFGWNRPHSTQPNDANSLLVTDADQRLCMNSGGSNTVKGTGACQYRSTQSSSLNCPSPLDKDSCTTSEVSMSPPTSCCEHTSDVLEGNGQITPSDISVHKGNFVFARERALIEKPPPVRPSILGQLSRSGSSLRKRFRLLNGDDSENQERDAADNILLNAMKEIEDRNIWNTIRDREYK